MAVIVDGAGAAVFVTLLLFSCCSTGLSSSAAATLESDCQVVVSSDMSSCLGFSTGKEDTPGAKCCGKVSDVKKKKPQCLCYAMEQTFSNPSFKKMGFQLDKILQLSTSCNIAGNVSDCISVLKLKPSDPLYAKITSASDAVNNNKTTLQAQHTTNSAGSISSFGHHVGVNYAGAAAAVSAVAAAIILSFFK